MKAMIVNRFGDFGLYFSILLIFLFFKTLNFTSLNSISFLLNSDSLHFHLLNFNISVQDFICFFLFFAVVGKSAQLGLHT
jgi:NADH-ubiquinone oxidoreductase chain 5